MDEETYCYYREGASENRINCFYFSYNFHCNHDFGPKEIQFVEPGHALKYIAPCSCPLRSKDDKIELDITPAFQIPWNLRNLEFKMIKGEIQLTENQIKKARNKVIDDLICKHSKEYIENFIKIRNAKLSSIKETLEKAGLKNLEINGETICYGNKDGSIDIVKKGMNSGFRTGICIKCLKDSVIISVNTRLCLSCGDI